MRLFVALDLPERVRDALPEPGAPWRAVPREQLHLTVAFLGDVDDPEDAEAALDAAGRMYPGDLRTRGCILLPPKRPRVLAVALLDVDDRCAALQQQVADLLVDVGVYEREVRPWLPHVTIGRTRERVARDTALPAIGDLEFRPTALTLYESRGGRYMPRWRRLLGPRR